MENSNEYEISKSFKSPRQRRETTSVTPRRLQDYKVYPSTDLKPYANQGGEYEQRIADKSLKSSLDYLSENRILTVKYASINAGSD
jgi:hypothetical protein